MRIQTASIAPARALFPLGLGTALSLMGDATIYTVLPTHAADAGITLASVGVLLGVNRAIRLFLNGPVGLVFDRSPRRRLFVPALFVGALSTALYAATRSFWPLFAARLLWGLAWSVIWVGGATMILDVTCDGDRGRWTGLYQSWFFLGTAAGSFLGGLFTDHFGYANTMWIGAAVTALGGVAALIFLPETRGAPYAATAGATVERAGLAHLAANPALWTAVALQGAGRFVGSGVLSATMGLIVRDQLQPFVLLLGLATLTGLFMAVRTLVSMAFSPLGGAISDRLGSRWAVMAWMVGGGAAGLVLIAWGAPGGVIVGTLIASASQGAMQSVATALTGDLAGRAARGRAIGLLATAGDLGAAVGPPFALALLPLIGLRGVFVACAVLFAAALPPILYLHVRERVAHAAPAVEA